MAAEVTKLGELLDDMAERDAVHIAVAPVIASCRLMPGDHIGFVMGGLDLVGRPASGAIGIVDPFLTKPVNPGDRFWMFLYPQTITSLRHQWTHPAFEAPDAERELVRDTERELARRDPMSASEQWIRRLAGSLDLAYAEFMGALREYVETGEYYCLGEDLPDELFRNSEQMWLHYRILTGTDTSSQIGRSDVPFRCSC